MAAFIDKYTRQVRHNAPVDYAGLTFYPLTVDKYELYAKAKQAFELMQSSLKVPKLARLPWCACLWALDEQCLEQTGKPGCFLTDVLCVLVEVLRLEPFSDAANGGQTSYPIFPAFKDGELTGIAIGRSFLDRILLDMRQMNDIRQIIAAQNGYEIPDESWNPDLVRAAQYNAQGKNAGIKFDLETLVYSVALHWNCKAEEVWDWPIRKFQQAQGAIDRSLNYQIYTLASATGLVKFDKGNPYPTWKFDKHSDMPAGFRTIAEIEETTHGMIQGA